MYYLPTNAICKLHLSELHLYGAKRLGMRSSNLLVALTNGGNSTQEENNGEERYELTNHLGNVLAVVSGNKATDGSAQILSLTDYYPFGMEMGGRKYSKLTADGGYRYGFTGHEKEIIKGAYIDFGARIYETRIAKFLTLDPLCEKYKSVSNYSFANSSPIYFIDSEGEKPKVAVILVTPEDIRLFEQHERPLEKAGYIVVKVTNGEDLIKELSKNSTPEDPIKNLIILSHASLGGCSAGGRGFYTSYEIEDLRSKIVSADYKSNDEYKSYYSAIDVDDFVEAILKGDNIQTYDLTILLGGCSAAGKAKLDKQPIFAEQISKGLGDKVIAVYASQGISLKPRGIQTLIILMTLDSGIVN